MSADEEMFEQTTHVSDGFGGRLYGRPRNGVSSQSTWQAEAGRMGTNGMPHLGRDIGDVAANGSDQAKRRLKIFQRVVVMLFIVPATLIVLGWILN